MPDNDLQQFIELLAACPSLSTLTGRELVIKDLKFAVPRSHGLTDKQDVAEIVRAGLNYRDGCARLWEIIKFYDGDTISTKNLTEYLQKTGRLSGASGNSQPAKHNMPFGGRETPLAELRRTLLDGGAAALVVTKGQGGVGKTSLAREYAYRHQTAYKLIGWLDANTSTSLMTGFLRLAKLLGLSELEDKKEEEIRRTVLEKLENTSDWLLIYDNADDPAQLKEWLPKVYTGHILITSRAQNWQYAKPLTVPLMSEDECLALLLEWLERPEWNDEKERETAAELCNELGYLTLAVAQAGAYIKAVGISIADYLTLFKQERLALFEEDDAQLADRKDKDNVATTYGLNVKKLEETNPAARDLLNLLAFFAPEPFRLELLKEAVDELPESIQTLVKSPLALNRATAEIRRYSLAAVDNGKISLHRLVGLAIRDRHLTEEGRRHWAATSIKLILTLYPNPDSIDYSDWSRCQELIEHANASANYALESKITQPAANVFNKTGLYLQQRANFTAARPLLERALTIREEDKVYPEVAASLSNLGTLLRDIGDYNAARPFYERALAIREKEFGVNHYFVSNSLNRLGSLLLDMENYNEAQPLLERALNIRRQT
jgi:tetratricopeptide (TPR) repeat protein